MMTKDYDFSFDLGRLKGHETSRKAIQEACVKHGGRQPPLTPDKFAEEVQKRVFTNECDSLCNGIKEGFQCESNNVRVSITEIHFYVSCFRIRNRNALVCVTK